MVNVLSFSPPAPLGFGDRNVAFPKRLPNPTPTLRERGDGSGATTTRRRPRHAEHGLGGRDLSKELKPKYVKNHPAYPDQLTYKLTGCTGSRRYMAPEVCFSDPYNVKADVYSFGILLY